MFLGEKFYIPFYIDASKVFFYSLLSQQPKICCEKSACPDRKYFQNETLGYDQFGYRKQFVPDTGLKVSQKCFQLSFQWRDHVFFERDEKTIHVILKLPRTGKSLYLETFLFKCKLKDVFKENP